MNTLYVFLGLSVLLHGCTGGGANVSKPAKSKEVKVSLVSGATSCSNKAPKVTAIRDSSAWRSAMTPRNIFPAKSTPSGPTPDFSKAQYYLVGAGEKSTTGYKLVLESNMASVIGDEVSLPVRLLSPAAGSMNGMMITNPCIMVKVEEKRNLEAKVESLGISSY